MADKKKRDFEPLPYYRWYWRDWRSSRSVQRLHYVARGLLRELLDEQWAKGFIPDDVPELADICGCPVSVMTTHWKALVSFFVPIHGVLVNERLEHERSDSDKTRAERSRAGRAGAEARKQTSANVGKSQQTVATPGTLLSSSSSKSNSKSSSESHSLSTDDAASRTPVAALAPEGARASGDPTPIGDVIPNFPWRGELTRTGTRPPIGFRANASASLDDVVSETEQREGGE